MKSTNVAGRLTPLLALLMAALFPAALAQEKGADGADTAAETDENALDADVESLGKAAERFVDAFNKKDAKAIAALFLETGEMVSHDGETIHGREAIEEKYKEIFGAEKPPQIALEASSVRLVAPTVAIEDGVIHFTTDENEEVKSIGYSATQVKQADGTWLIASTRDQVEVTPPCERLKPLVWMEGDWTYEGADGVKMALSLDLDDSGNFLLGDAVATDEDGDVQNTSIRIGWNPATSSVYWWTFDSDGGNCTGQWIRKGDTWVIRSSGITADAETNAATQKLQREGEDTIVWSSADRVLAGEPLPDVELRLVRRAPDPEADTVAAAPDDSDAAEESEPESESGTPASEDE